MVVGVMLLSSCAPGVAPEEFAKVQGDLATVKSDLAATQNQIKALSAMSAYAIWWDQYYSIGTVYQIYAFADTASFNKKLGALIGLTGDSATQAAWKDYLTADSALSDLVKSYPSDYTKWTADQTSKWTTARDARLAALGKVGTDLFSIIVK
jgi:hypothetical protein